MTKLKMIAVRCYAFRKMLGITQATVAKELNIGQSTISAFEAGNDNNAIIYQWYLEKGLSPDLHISPLKWTKEV